MGENPLFEDIKIAEFSWVVVGTSASRYLAEHGATVIKIESHRRLDTLRCSSPFVNGIPSVDTSMFYGRHNSNKYSVSIDLQHPEGKKLAWKIIEWADIMTENFSPGTMTRMGLDYENVRRVKPEIIYLSSSMQGQDGPHSSYAGYGQNAVNLCGFTELSGWPDRMPAAPYGAYTDYICTRFISLGLIAALDYRRRTGRGMYLEQSQFESALHFISPPVMDYQINGNIMKRDGNRLPEAAPHGVFRCKGDDNWIAISVINDEQWQNFCAATGLPSPDREARFSTLKQRKKHEEELEKLINDWTARYSPEDAETILQQAGIPSGVVKKPSDLYSDPQLKVRKYFTPLTHPVMGMQNYEAQSCFILSDNPREITGPSPCLGEHNEYVFKQLLGMNDEDIADRVLDGSITTALAGEFQASM